MKNLRQYEIVLEIARHGSISKAAEAMHISQPTLSRLLQKTEGQLGMELFDRSSIPLRLTAFGERYAAAGQRILDINHQLQKELNEVKNPGHKVLKIGISPSRAPYMLPQLLKEYRTMMPEGKIVVKERNTVQLGAELERGELDLIISLLNDGTRSFSYKPLFSETTVLAAPDSMASMDTLSILKSQPIISIGSGLRMWKSLRVILEAVNGREPEIECQSIESALALVNQGMGAMLVPSYIAGYGSVQRENVVFKALPPEYYEKFRGELERKVCVFYRGDRFLTTAESLFVEACERIAENR